MSRLAEAYRKASAGGIVGPGALEWQAVRDVVSESLAPTEVPWSSFSESEAPGYQVRPPDTPLAPESAEARKPSLVDLGVISREEVAALTRRLYEPGTAQTRRRAVLFSAVGPEGLSARVSAMVSDVLASQGTGSVCLVDANLRSPTLHDLVGLAGTRGLSELLLEGGEARLVVSRVAANLWVLPAGSRGAEALEYLSAEQLRRRVQELLGMFDYLVVDAAAANAQPDAVVLGPLLDGVVLVVAANDTRRETARRTVDHLQGAGAKVLGAVLAGRTFPIPEAIYRKL